MVIVTTETQTGYFQNATASADDVHASLCCAHEIVTVKLNYTDIQRAYISYLCYKLQQIFHINVGI
jgi:hypothetical protein